MELIRAMLATPGAIADPAFTVGDWAYEMKWDGVRAVVHVGPDRVRVFSRNDRDVSISYPELQPLAAALSGHRLVLDGEVVAIDGSGRPSFGLLQQRMHVTDPGAAARLSRSVPAVLLAFDLLRLDGTSLLDQPYAHRRELLDDLGLDEAFGQVPPAYPASADDGAAAAREALEGSRAAGLEGIVAKRTDSLYRPGVRSPDWVKIKHIRMQEVVIGGWRPGQGRRESTIGSLLMGVQTSTGLHYVGHVGTGFSQAALRALGAQLAALRQHDTPFTNALPREVVRDAQWVRPELVGEVAFTEWTGDDRLRHPAWRGLRPDKAPTDVVRET